ncbi:MAG: RdgB/HAM1 family non-canonical purine NTP pyrophosphatase [Planctomycetota bacterium]
MFELILGTGNAKKLRELEMLLPSEAIRVRALSEFSAAIEVDETGSTFAENAALKACEQAVNLDAWVLAEDSGLTVDALKGEPGVYSARYAGTHGDDEANNDKLLRELEGVPTTQRSAAFHCHACLSDPQGNVQLTSHGVCRGVIAAERSGGEGFGYDPLFVIPEYHKTFGQLGMAVKRAISHRSQAMRILVPELMQLIGKIEASGASN